jgi:hypothetical protein
MTEPSPQPPHQPRKFLRAAIGVLLVVGMATGYWAMHRQQVQKQSKAVESIQRSGGRVYLEYQWRDGAPDPEPTPPRETLARRLLGSEGLDRVVAVDLTTAVDMDQAINALRWLPHLEFLDARGASLADKTVESLGRITSLRSLILAQTEITDSSVEVLVNLRLLKQLDVAGTRISEAGVRRLRARLPRCEVSD